jgi:hypothetical protein
MSQSIREQILQALLTTLAPVALAQGATLLRSPVHGVPREASPALLLFPESDTIVQRPNDRVERQLVVRLVALARESGSVPPEALADQILVVAHAALFHNVNLGGLALGIRELDCEWDVEDADAGAAAIPARYQITYRTLAADLTQPG